MAIISEDAMNAALVRELCSGRLLMEQKQPFREIEAAKVAASMKGHRMVQGLGKHVAEIPQHEYFIIREKYGDECWHDPEFVRDCVRHNPHLGSNKI